MLCLSVLLFKNVRVLPQMLVLTATGPDGKPTTMIVDSNTMRGYAFDNLLPDSDVNTKPNERVLALR